MDVKELYALIIDALPDSPQESDEWNGFWANKEDQEIMCGADEHAFALADFLEDLGYDVVHAHYYSYEESIILDKDVYGWWGVYPD